MSILDDHNILRVASRYFPSLAALKSAVPSAMKLNHLAEIVRFWIDSGDCWGFLFHHVSGTYYSAKEQRLLIDCGLGTIVVTGPKALEFYEQFSNHRATLIRADGKDILSVKMHLNSEGLAEKDAKEVTPEIGGEDLSL